MARLIIKTNLANKNFSVEQKVLTVGDNENVENLTTEIIISSNKDYIIDAKDFSTGILPSEIKKINFINDQTVINDSNNVVAKIEFNTIKIINFKTLFLPITGFATLIKNEIILNDHSPIRENVFVSDSNIIKGVSTISNSAKSTRYNISGNPGEKVKIFTKKLTVPDGYYFDKNPQAFVGQSPSSRYYSITSFVTKNKDRKIISKTFEVYVTFPNTSLKDKYEDNIFFDYHANLILENQDTIASKERERDAIYNIDTGTSVGTSGGNRRYNINGIPGTPFRFMVSTTDGTVYNFDTGNFEAGASFLEGIIPEADPGVGYGTYKTIVEIPKSVSGATLKSSLFTDEIIDHEALADQLDGTTITSEINKLRTSTVEETVKGDGTFVITMHDGGLTDLRIYRPLFSSDEPVSSNYLEHEGVDYLKNGTYSIGPAAFGSSVESWLNSNPFKIRSSGGIINTSVVQFLITTANEEQYIRLNRDALFDQAKNFITWDSAYSDDDTKSFNSSGTAILTDWGNITANPDENLDFKESVPIITTTYDGLGEALKHGVTAADDPYAYKFITLNITVSGSFGSASITPELNLKNFLSIETIS